MNDEQLHQSTSYAQQLAHYEFEPHAIDERKYIANISDSQRRGVAFMIYRETHRQWCQLGGIISDSLGTGKTLQTLVTIVEQLYSVRQQRNHSEITLIIAPSVVLYEWLSQAKKHLQPETLRIVAYHGADRKKPANGSFDVLLTTYGIVQREFSEHRRPNGNGHFTHWHAPDDQESPFEILFDRVIIDEAHNIRNRNTTTHKAVCAINAEKHWAISATLIYNRIDDLYASLHFLEAEPYCTWPEFNSAFVVGVHDSHLVNTTLEKLRQFLLPIQIRRPKPDTLPPLYDVRLSVDLNEDERFFYDTLLSYTQDTVSRLFRVHRWLRNTGWARAHTNLALRARHCILSSVMRLRQACVNPQMVIDAFNKSHWNTMPLPPSELSGRLWEGASIRLRTILDERLAGKDNECGICYDEQATDALIPCGHTLCPTCAETILALSNVAARCPFCKQVVETHRPITEAIENRTAAVSDDDEVMSIERTWEPNSTKIKAVIDHFQNALRNDPTTKCLIFSQWRYSLDCICRCLREININYLRIDGTVVSKKKRIDFQERFNSDASIQVMVCSLNCSSEGINLQGANLVYIVDPWWTDTREEQAGNRAHRIGQTRPVTIYHVITNNTIEERVLSMQARKRELMDVTNGTRDSVSWDEEVVHLLDS
jgi:SWI/SNF-related matrix-associated actin-dependent regulator of chromatin subfamily A3|uniref:RING-type domain-containing protein n=1 Tax=viral metagenome TaxID=1070528 RepID=A0A6C0IUP7_9ZZZZ